MSAVNTQPKLKVHILCGGIRYGLGEEIWAEVFKQAWLYNTLGIPGNGENLVPTIHILDLSRLVKRIVD